MQRRDFLKFSVTLTGLRSASFFHGADPKPSQAMTVQGPIASTKLGVTLAHEHVMVDFIGADRVSRDRYDANDVFAVAMPHLKRLRGLGCQSLMECTPAYLGRDPALLRRLAAASGIQILTNTGYYGAVKGKYLPAHVLTEKPDQLAARWLREWKDGIEDSGVRPGFIKIGVDAGALSEVNRKLVRAAARTHLQSGLTIAAHTGDGAAALDELEVLHEEGVDGRAFIWVHAQNEKDTSLHARAAEQGAWIEFDGVGPQTIQQHLELVKAMKAKCHLNHVLLSHDAGWYQVGEPGGGKFLTYETLFTDFIPAMKVAGFTEAEVSRLIVDNPREAFSIRVREWNRP